MGWMAATRGTNGFTAGMFLHDGAEFYRLVFRTNDMKASSRFLESKPGPSARAGVDDSRWNRPDGMWATWPTLNVACIRVRRPEDHVWSILRVSTRHGRGPRLTGALDRAGRGM
jgi:hypothetical protein